MISSVVNGMELLPEGGVAVDVGASLDGDDWLGYMLQTASKVYAFEPEPLAFANLKERYGARQNLVLEQKACIDVEGLVRLGRYGSHLTTLFDEGIKDEACGGLEACGITLDSYFAEVPRIDLLKIDVDGGECQVLRGARKVIGRSAGIKLVLEIHAVWLERHGVSAASVAALLADLGLVLMKGLDLTHMREGEPLDGDTISGFGDCGYNVLLKRV